jgi:hypothetical protein
VTGWIGNWSTWYWAEILAGFDLDPEGRYSGTLEIVSDRPLLVCARIYNQTEHGTLGQGMPALVPGDGLRTIGVLPMLERSADYRTNVGFLNLSSKTCTVHVDVYSEAGGAFPLGSRVTTELPSRRWAQVDDVFEAAGLVGNVWSAYASVMLEPPDCEVWSYASVVDNQTGDATTIPVLAVELMPGR